MANTTEKPGDFEIMKRMAFFSEKGKIVACPDLYDCRQVKAGGAIAMGVETSLYHDFCLKTGKYIPILYLVDSAEYKKVKAQLLADFETQQIANQNKLSFPELVDQLARDRGTATQPDWESPEARLILDAVKMYAMGVAQTALNQAAENVCSRSENMPAAIYWVGPEIEEADIVLP